MLLEGCDLLGLEEGTEGLSFVVRGLYPEGELVSVVGSPASGTIVEAVSRNGGSGAVIAMPENARLMAETLPGWEMQPAILHLLGEAGLQESPANPAPSIRLISGQAKPFVLPPALSTDLRAELEDALHRGTPLAATFVEGVPVSFCYAASETESLWDVAIDTLGGYRRRGHAARCAAFLVRHMRRTTGKEPVWGALETNAASMNLAASLGFVPVDRYFALERAGSGPSQTFPAGYAPSAGTTW